MNKIISRIERVNKAKHVRYRIVINGVVQGVGFRPFIYRLATDLGLKGCVNNCPHGVFIEAEGTRVTLREFLTRLEQEKPQHAIIHDLQTMVLDPYGYQSFEITQSDTVGDLMTFIQPDIATCPTCLEEIFDPTNRRYRYPFTNCTECGPRFSIIESLPYDRPNTTMKNFIMCADCVSEYENPVDRRFHAQPNACPKCGPHIELWDPKGETIADTQDALKRAVECILQGSIVALKGLGGYQLVTDARNNKAVMRLRQRKYREEKPFALMYPCLELVKTHCHVSDLEEKLLRSPESPIVLLRRKNAGRKPALFNSGPEIAVSVAPNNPYLGIMLPNTPLHNLLLDDLGIPVVATSGNLSDEPICFDDHEALNRLGGIADVFLVHNRPISRHVDDSVVRVVDGRELVLRRARGYAPLPVILGKKMPATLAVGAHLKNAIAVAIEDRVFIGQHIGDLETAHSFDAFQQSIQGLTSIYKVRPVVVACDVHPDYVSTKYAENSRLPIVKIQHHFAHVLSCMAENKIEGPLLGVAWDGAGYGLDGTIWGGEFLQVSDGTFKRVAHFRKFLMPGGEIAMREPRRVALSILSQIFGESILERKDLAPVKAFNPSELKVVHTMIRKKLNSPVTTSAGRLFDAVASILGLRQKINFEGQAACELEFAIDNKQTNTSYQFRISEPGFQKEKNHGHNGNGEITNPQSLRIVDWEPLIREMLDDISKNISSGKISARFHNTLAEIIVTIARFIGEKTVVLTGGCFQNKYLTERSIKRLKQEGFRPYWHKHVPPNDGGIALGQVKGVKELREEEPCRIIV